MANSTKLTVNKVITNKNGGFILVLKQVSDADAFGTVSEKTYYKGYSKLTSEDIVGQEAFANTDDTTVSAVKSKDDPNKLLHFHWLNGSVTKA